MLHQNICWKICYRQNVWEVKDERRRRKGLQSNFVKRLLNKYLELFPKFKRRNRTIQRRDVAWFASLSGELIVCFKKGKTSRKRKNLKAVAVFQWSEGGGRYWYLLWHKGFTYLKYDYELESVVIGKLMYAGREKEKGREGEKGEGRLGYI